MLLAAAAGVAATRAAWLADPLLSLPSSCCGDIAVDRQARKVVVRAGGDETVQLTGVVFQPFSEVCTLIACSF
jgi:hypothetical protein